jgi:plastocyanin
MAPFRLIAGPVALSVLAACGGYNAPTGTNNNNPPPAATSNDINIVVGASTKTTNAFSPNPKAVSLGGASTVSVRWVNGDISGGDYTMGTAVIHDIVSDDNSFQPSGSLGGNATYTINLSAARDYAYHCNIHPNMTGTIHVTP